MARVSAWYTLFDLPLNIQKGMVHGHRQRAHILLSIRQTSEYCCAGLSLWCSVDLFLFDADVLPSSCPPVTNINVILCRPALLGDALTDKIVEMHESCMNEGEGGASASTGEGKVEGLETSATPKEYISFLRSWFTMHESKKVPPSNVFRANIFQAKAQRETLRRFT